MWKVLEIVEVMDRINKEKTNLKPLSLLGLTIDELIETLPDDAPQAVEFGQRPLPDKTFLKELSNGCKLYAKVNRNLIDFFLEMNANIADAVIRDNSVDIIFAAFFDRYFDVCLLIIRKISHDSLIKSTAKEVARVVNGKSSLENPKSYNRSILEFQASEFLTGLISEGVDSETYLHIPLKRQQLLKVIEVLVSRLVQQKPDPEAEKNLKTICNVLVQLAARYSEDVDVLFAKLIAIFQAEKTKKPNSPEDIALHNSKLLWLGDALFKLELSDEKKDRVREEVQSVVAEKIFDEKTNLALTDMIMTLRLSLSRHEMDDADLTQFIERLYKIEIDTLVISDDKASRFTALCKAELAKLNFEFIFDQYFSRQMEISVLCNNLLKIFPNNCEIEEMVYKVLNIWADIFSYEHQKLKLQNKLHKLRASFLVSTFPNYQFMGELLAPPKLNALTDCLEYGLEMKVDSIVNPPTTWIGHHFTMFNVMIDGSKPDESAIEKIAKNYCGKVVQVYQLLGNLVPEKTEEYKRKRYEDSKKILKKYDLSRLAKHDILFENCLAAAGYAKAEVPEAWKTLIGLVWQQNTSILNERFDEFNQVASKCLVRWSGLFVDIIDLFYQGGFFAKYALAIIRNVVVHLSLPQLTGLQKMLETKYDEAKLNLVTSAYYYKLAYLATQNILQILTPKLSKYEFKNAATIEPPTLLDDGRIRFEL